MALLCVATPLVGCSDDEAGGAGARDTGAGDANGGAGDARPEPARPDSGSPDSGSPDTGPPPGDAAGSTQDATGPNADAAGPNADAAGPDAGPRPDGDVAPDARPAPEPLDLPEGQWSWLPIDDMRCANGVPTGIGVSPAPGGSRRLMMYLIGGGACWDHETCYRINSAAFIADAFGAAEFGQLNLDGFWFFNRGNVENPFADHHQVFVPYCTGDIHAGDRVTDYGGRRTHHVGAVNFTRLARRLSAAYPDLERVIVVGGSAGGYGALFNWERARAAFPGARVDVIDDAGAPIPPPHFPAARQALWSAAWDLDRTLPADCPACRTDWSALIPYTLSRDPTARMGLLTAMSDGVIAEYMGIDGATFRRGMEALLLRVEAPGFGGFLIDGREHVLMAGPYVAGGQTVPQWIGAMQADDPAWGTVGPSPLPACEVLDDCAQCAVCATQGPCLDAYRACERLRGCQEAVVCATNCQPNDAPCIAACSAAHNSGATAIELYACLRCNTCPHACGACP